MPEVAIEARSLTKRYASHTAVEGLSFSIYRGEIFGLLGPNGAGKTSTVKMLAGITWPTEGTGAIFGHPIESLEASRYHGYSPERPYLYEFLTAEEILRFYYDVERLPASQRAVVVDELLAIVGLEGARRQRVRTFSKGMVHRLGIAQALIGDPPILFLDEPGTGLDPIGRIEVRNLLVSLKKRGKTLFMNSNILADVELVCDRVGILNKGRLMALKTLEEVRARASAVEVTGTGLTPRAIHAVARAVPGARVQASEGGIRIHGCPADQVPGAVAALVAAKVRIRSVEPLHPSLEDLFFELVHESGD